MKKLILIFLMIGIHTVCQAKPWQDYTSLGTYPADGDTFLINDISETGPPDNNPDGTVKSVQWTYIQPRDSDLTSIAALTTTTYGRALLEIANAAALLSAAGITATAAEINTPLDGASVTLTEFQELETIDDTTISAGQWVFVGAQDQATYTTSSPTFVSVTVSGAAGNGGFEIDPFPDTDETCEGIISTMTAGVDSIVVGACLTIDSANGEYIFANASSEDTRCVAIACEDADDQDTFEIMTYGYIREDSMYDFTANDLIFLEETDGVVIDEDDTMPDTTGDIIQIVGVAVSADVFLFNPQLYYNLLE